MAVSGFNVKVCSYFIAMQYNGVSQITDPLYKKLRHSIFEKTMGKTIGHSSKTIG